MIDFELLSKVILESVKKLPWPVLALIIALGGWAFYERSSRQALAAEVVAAKVVADTRVAATDNDKDNLKIYYIDQADKIKAELCGCRVALARSEATQIKPALPPKPRPRPPIQPQEEICK